MGRYDGPHFDTDEEDMVSIWIAKCNLNDVPEDYFLQIEEGDDEDGESEDDLPFTKFSLDFGFGYFDYDFAETYCKKDWSQCDIADLIRPLSYSSSFLDSCVSAARHLKVDETSFVFLI